MTALFQISPHTTIDKQFTIEGPDDFKLLVDYDDVEHELQDAMAIAVVNILNSHWSMRGLLHAARELKADDRGTQRWYPSE